MWDVILGRLGTLIQPITTWVDHWQQRKDAQLKSDLAVNEAVTNAKIRAAETAQNAEIDWDHTAVAQMDRSWKDEWFTILLSIPLILCFVPGGDVYVERGFAAVGQNVPEWWQASFLAAVAASFGIRKLTDLISAFRK